MSGVKRLDPRRPYRIGPQGLRRIVLGEVGAGDFASRASQNAKTSRTKPLRTKAVATGWHMAIAHAYRGRLDDHAREAIAAAAILASPQTGVIAVILGAFHEDAGALGADKVLIADDLDASRFEPRREEVVVEAFINEYQPERIFLPDNALGDGDLGRRLIAKLGSSAATHVSEIDSRHVAIIWSSGGCLANAPLPRIVLLEPGSVDSNLPFIGAGEIIRTALTAGVPEVCGDLGLEATEMSSIALEEADFIVSAGNGVRNVETLEEMAKCFDATVGASRVAVDDGRFPRSKQIGASGKTVSATTYIAVGISGAIQHLQGIKACRHVIAINSNPGAPIAKRADLTVVGDAEEVMQALIARVGQARAQSEQS